MWLVLASLASAGPSRCVATWTGPVPGCAIRGEVAASATALSEPAAQRALRHALEEAIDRSVAATRARIPSLESAQFVLCAEKIQDAAFVNCFEDATLAEPAFCFVSLDDPACWSGEVLHVEAVGWVAHRLGRDRMCAAVDKRLVAQDYTDVATRRAICADACAAHTTVRCPSTR